MSSATNCVVLVLLVASYGFSGCLVSANVLTVTVDNVLILYINGTLVSGLPNANTWPTADSVTLPPSLSVVAIEGTDQGSIYGILASDSDGLILTNQSWKCTEKNTLSVADQSQWMNIGYNDSAWPPAKSFGLNDGSNKVWGVISGINSQANWIWDDSAAVNSDVVCRLTLCTRTTTGATCVNDCTGMPIGDYQDCNVCTSYLTCWNGATYVKACPDAQLWDDNAKMCQDNSTTCAAC